MLRRPELLSGWDDLWMAARPKTRVSASARWYLHCSLWPVVRRDSVDRQYRHAAVVEPAGFRGRSLGMAGGVLDLGRFRRRGGLGRVRAGAATGGRACGPVFAARANDGSDPARSVTSI